MAIYFIRDENFNFKIKDFDQFIKLKHIGVSILISEQKTRHNLSRKGAIGE